MKSFLNLIGIIAGIVCILISGTDSWREIAVFACGTVLFGANMFLFLKRRKREARAKEQETAQ